MKTVNVEMLKSTHYNGKKLQIGEKASVPEVIANAWINTKRAVSVLPSAISEPVDIACDAPENGSDDAPKKKAKKAE